jgi:hypothetical protein
VDGGFKWCECVVMVVQAGKEDGGEMCGVSVARAIIP